MQPGFPRHCIGFPSAICNPTSYNAATFRTRLNDGETRVNPLDLRVHYGIFKYDPYRIYKVRMLEVRDENPAGEPCPEHIAPMDQEF